MIKLYGPARSSAGRCLWLLEELNLPYENINVDMMKKEHKADWYLDINPNGKVPALVDDDLKLFESFAINYYLAEKYKPEFLGKDAKEKALTQQWSYWAATELQGPMIEIFIQKVFMPEGKKDLAAIEKNEKMLPELFSILNKSLENRAFLNGNEFTLADLNVASVASIAHPIGFDMKPYNNINGWMGRIADRQSFNKYMSLRK